MCHSRGGGAHMMVGQLGTHHALSQVVKDRDELIQRLKGAEVVAAQKLKREQEATNAWKVKIAGKQDTIDEQGAHQPEPPAPAERPGSSCARQIVVSGCRWR
jgi:hypothetical protein